MKIYSDGFFSIDPTHGFLPIQEPLHILPKTYQALQELVDQMPIQLENGAPGLLATEGAFEKKSSSLTQLFRSGSKRNRPFCKSSPFYGL